MSKGRKIRKRDKRRQADRDMVHGTGGTPGLVAAPPGGQGGFVPEPPTRSELVLDGVAARRPHLYGLTQADREHMAGRSLGVLNDPAADVRHVMTATRNLLVMQQQENDLCKAEAGKDGQSAGNTTTNIYVNGDVRLTPDRLRSLDADELIRRHRETLDLPLSDQDEVPRQP